MISESCQIVTIRTYVHELLYNDSSSFLDINKPDVYIQLCYNLCVVRITLSVSNITTLLNMAGWQTGTSSVPVRRIQRIKSIYDQLSQIILQRGEDVTRNHEENNEELSGEYLQVLYNVCRKDIPVN